MCEFQAQICNISRSESSHILSPWSNAEKTSIKELDNTQDEIFRYVIMNYGSSNELQNLCIYDIRLCIFLLILTF